MILISAVDNCRMKNLHRLGPISDSLYVKKDLFEGRLILAGDKEK